MKIVAGSIVALALVAVLSPAQRARDAMLLRAHAFAAPGCEAIASMAPPGARIRSAQIVPAGTFVPPATRAANDDDPPAPQSHPAFCRVVATLMPTTDSDIAVEVWLPQVDWNGKFQAVGNGAFGGSIGYPAMMTALNRGYAVAGTDTGHTGGGASFAFGHPEKLADFAWRAVHEMTTFSKSVVTSHYERAPQWSYWYGCSGGGRQALKEAQRFPGDYDGIIAGDPGHDWVARASQAVKMLKQTENASARLLEADRRLLHVAVVKACDVLDGVADGLIADPTRCSFDLATLRCSSAAASSCLSDLQVGTARLMYAPLKNADTGRVIGGQVPGSELGWTDRGWTTSAQNTGRDQFRFVVFKNPTWVPLQFNGEADVARAEAEDAGLIDARSTDLTPYFARGGRLIQYHGWSDPQISPLNSVSYYQSVVSALGASTVERSYRLFMAPGMGHCRGGEGPNTFDALSALEAWVERGEAPARIVASRTADGVVTRTRPLCPYPLRAVYSGRGSIDDAANFACRP